MALFGKENGTSYLLQMIRDGKELTLQQQILLAVMLSIPSILSQMSNVVMSYIDASMVGSLGAEASASVGLMSTTIWLCSGLCASVSTSFAVQVAHMMGANNRVGAREIFRQAITVCLAFGIFLGSITIAISGKLPVWLGGSPEIVEGASDYFFIYACFIPVLQLKIVAGAVIRCSGNLKFPSAVNISMCFFDVLFNYFFIFVMDMGVVGAAWGTAAAVTTSAILMLGYAVFISSDLRLTREKGSFLPKKDVLAKAFHIGMPVGIERIMFNGAQILATRIVAPLGTFSIAANSFGITAESLCYMPGYGISEASTTLIGQGLGAMRISLTRKLARITITMGMCVMALMGVVMYFAAPYMIGFMTDNQQILELGVSALRIEAFAEPMFAASIVCYGVFVGAGDTLVPCTMNLCSIWIVRLTLAYFLAPVYGLNGVWLAMCIELCFRGVIFLCRFKWGNWMHLDRIGR